jgi:hypothetical protein
VESRITNLLLLNGEPHGKTNQQDGNHGRPGYDKKADAKVRKGIYQPDESGCARFSLQAVKFISMDNPRFPVLI